MIRGYRFRLYPTPAQAEDLARTASVCRFIYNLALEQRRNWWRQYKANEGRQISFPSQSRELTLLRAEFDWIAAVNRTAQEQALRDLDQAFANFFAGRASFPDWRKQRDRQTFRLKGAECRAVGLNAKWGEVKLGGVGTVKFRLTRQLAGELRNVTVSYGADGWTASFVMQSEDVVRTNDLPAVGIDRGVANAITLSTGEMRSLPASLHSIVRQRVRAQRVLARRKRGSNRYRVQKAIAAKHSAKLGRARADWLHRESTDIARRFGTVAIEALKITNMTAAGRGKRGLNRSILHQGWGMFATMLDYKLAERGGQLLTVNPAYTSQTCVCCGTVDARSRESQASFRCVECGHADHADVNAAKNILRRSTAWLDVEGAHFAPREASTVEPLAA